MNAYRINNLLSQISQDSEKTLKLKNKDDVFLSSFGLTEEEKDAVMNCNATKLHEAGVHPLLMMQLSILLEKDIKQLYKDGM